MAFARVVTFDGVGDDRIAQLKTSIETGERPADLPATEIMLLHDADAQRAIAILFFDSEDDYRQGDAIMNAMPVDDTPGHRSSVTKYVVAVRATA
jgi:hypothetical protein